MIPDTEFEGFRVDEVLSRSSTVNVYRAYQYSLKRNVLIKELRPELFQEADIRSRFEQEAQLCALLKHENIADIYDYSTANQRIYLIMEFVDGCSLADCLTHYPSPPLDLILSIIPQTLKGLGYAHSKGVIHRDLKPSNILISKDGWVKITDFGLARFEGSPLVTMPGAVVGTPAYLSPEAIAGGAVTSRSDIFSLGVTFYQLLTGEKIFHAEHFSDSLKKVLNFYPPKPSHFRADIPSELDVIILRMLEKHPNKRWANCGEIAASLDTLELLGQVGDPKTVIKRFLAEPGSLAASELISTKTPSSIQTKKKQFRLPIVLGLAVVFLAIVAFFIWRDRSSSVPKSDFKTVEQTAQMMKTESVPDSILTLSTTIPKHLNQKGEAQKLPKSPESASSTVPSLIISGKDSIQVATKAPEILIPAKPLKRNDRTPQDSSGIKNADFQSAAIPAVLAINCDPWADVYLDGNMIGKTPFDTVRVSQGNHRLLFSHPNFQPIVRDITLKSGEELSLRVSFWETVGRIIIIADPWADIYIDHQYIDTTPLKEPLSVPFGSHIITLKNPTTDTWEQPIKLEKGAPPCTLRVELKKSQG